MDVPFPGRGVRGLACTGGHRLGGLAPLAYGRTGGDAAAKGETQREKLA